MEGLFNSSAGLTIVFGFIGTFLAIHYALLPAGLKEWSNWQRTKKPIHLSLALSITWFAGTLWLGLWILAVHFIGGSDV
jgi:hypothetical protein